MTKHIQAPCNMSKQSKVLDVGDIETLDITTWEWWDKHNGVTYSSGQLTINYDEIVVYFEFEGSCNAGQISHYAEYWLHYATGGAEKYHASGMLAKLYMRDYRDDHGVIIRTVQHDRCLQRDAKRNGKIPTWVIESEKLKAKEGK